MEQAEALQEDFTEETYEAPADESQEEITNEDTDIEETTDEVENSEEVEYTEIEYDGSTYNVPPELKDAIMRQSDYTQKTQEVAEQRKALESEVQQFQQAAAMQARNMQGHAQLAAMQSQLQQYEGIDWNQAIADNPTEANQAFVQYTQLKDAVSNKAAELQQQEAQALQQQRELTARQLEQGKAELARDIPGWGAEMAQKINHHGETYGFTQSELSQVYDPRMVKVLHDAMMYRQSLKKATEAPKPNVKPASKVKGRAKGQKDPNKMSTDEWLKWRNNQIANS